MTCFDFLRKARCLPVLRRLPLCSSQTLTSAVRAVESLVAVKYVSAKTLLKVLHRDAVAIIQAQSSISMLVIPIFVVLGNRLQPYFIYGGFSLV